MKKLHSSVALAALAAIFMAAPAVAADIEAPPPPAYSWTGFHVGVGGGGMFGFVQEDSDSFFNSNVNGLHASDAHHSDLGDADFFGTVEAGFDWQLGSSFVLGVLANYDFGKVKMDNESEPTIFNNNNNIHGPGTYKTSWEIGDTWAIGGRLGFLAMDNALIYVTGGWTEARIKSESDLFDADGNQNARFHTSDSSWEDGWFVGGGIEALLTENLSLKAEYRFADYGSVNRDDSIDVVDVINANSNQDGDVTVHTVRAVLSWRFNLGL